MGTSLRTSFRLWLVIVLLSFASPAWATHYFIDCSPTGCGGGGCSNANNGTSAATAWADPSTVVTRALQPGDEVSTNQGQTCSYPSAGSQADFFALGSGVGGTAGNPITFDTYGSGAQPLILGSDNLSGATWTNDTVNIYTTPLSVFPMGVYTSTTPSWPLAWAACETSPCPGTPAVTQPAMLSCWQSGHVYAANSQVMSCVRPSEWFITTAGGTSGGTAPTCTTSCTANTTTESDGGVTWIYEGPGAAMQGAMTAGTAWWSANKLYVWMPNNASPSGQTIRVATHIYGFNDQANGAEKNYITITGLDFQQFGTCWRAFTNGTGGFLAGQIFTGNTCSQTGTGPVDAGDFYNSLQVGGSNSNGTTPAPLITNNVISYAGGHMGGLACQACTNGVFSGNDISFFSHAALNFVSSTTTSNTNLTATNNKIHDAFQALNYNSPSAPSSNVGIYCENCPSPTITFNSIWNIKGTCGSGQCDGIQTFGGSNAVINCNTIFGVQTGYYESNGGTNETFKDNAVDISTGGGTPGTNSWAINENDSGAITTADYDILGGETSVWTINGSNKTFAQLQALGYEAHGFNAYAAFAQANPFILLPNSPGFLTGDGTCPNATIGSSSLFARGNSGFRRF